jgi:hypothetical protein
MTKQEYIGAFLDGYFSGKKLEYGFAYLDQLEKAEQLAKNQYKKYEKQFAEKNNLQNKKII